MDDKLIEFNKGDCISLFINDSYESIYAVTKIIRDINSNETIIFNTGNPNTYFPCKRVTVSYGWDLKYTINKYKDDFSIAIINCLSPTFNTKETIEFIKFLKEDESIKNKTFILAFYLNDENFEIGEKIDYKFFEVYKDLIFKYCNKHYSFYPSHSDYTDEQWTCENLIDKTKKKYRLKNWNSDELRLIDNDEYLL